MSQHDYIIDNQLAPAFRADLNAALGAIVTQNSGATAPPTTYANMVWYDTANDLLKVRNEANSGWITMGTINQTTSLFESSTVNGKTIDTLVGVGGVVYATSTTSVAAISSGTSGQVLQSNGTSAPTWSNSQSIGIGQTWQDVSGSRAVSTSYQNTTGRPISVSLTLDNTARSIQISVNNSTWIDVAQSSGSRTSMSFIVPESWYYRINGSTVINVWAELR